MSGELKEEYEEITHEIKNADMDVIPTPFTGFDNDHRVILVDPMGGVLGDLLKYQNAGGGEEIANAINDGYFTFDNTEIKRAAPKGVPVHKMKLK